MINYGKNRNDLAGNFSKNNKMCCTFIRVLEFIRVCKKDASRKKSWDVQKKAETGDILM